MLVLKVLGILLVVAGVAMVFMARQIVEKYNLSHKAKVDFEHEMGEEELKEFKKGKAAVNMKMLGMLVALPGFILILIAFK
jgi:hypothetical protein